MSDYPAGTVTFLLTDIEGSTELWEGQPGAMRQALARHDDIIEKTVKANDGVVVRPRGEGDSRFAVFPQALDQFAPWRKYNRNWQPNFLTDPFRCGYELGCIPARLICGWAIIMARQSIAAPESAALDTAVKPCFRKSLPNWYGITCRRGSA